MSETLATKTNNPSEELDTLYARWGRAGAGILLTGNVMIDREALGEPGDVVIYEEIRKQVGEDFPIGLKLHSADFQRGVLQKKNRCWY